MGSAEAEPTDSAPKPAKIRPMRVEMYLCVRTGNSRGCPNLASTHKYIAADSGEPTKSKMILAVLINFQRIILPIQKIFLTKTTKSL